jgi:ribosomal protein L5
MKEKFQYKSVMEIPKLEKIVVNMGLGDAKENAKALESAVSEMGMIVGQNQSSPAQKNPFQTLKCVKECRLVQK